MSFTFNTTIISIFVIFWFIA